MLRLLRKCFVAFQVFSDHQQKFEQIINFHVKIWNPWIPFSSLSYYQVRWRAECWVNQGWWAPDWQGWAAECKRKVTPGIIERTEHQYYLRLHNAHQYQSSPLYRLSSTCPLHSTIMDLKCTWILLTKSWFAFLIIPLMIHSFTINN